MPEMTEEQARELQEKLKQMSPEELREFQKKQCIFCHIVSGKVQSKKVYEDDKALAILDINPANPGHIILIPKEHYTIMPQVPDDEIEHLFIVARSLSNVALKALEAQGTNIIIANGVAAGQKAQHFMIHIIPRREKDGLMFTLPQKSISDEELNAISDKLSEALSRITERKAIKEKKPETMKIVMPKMPEEKKVVEAEFKEPVKKVPKKTARKTKKKEEKQNKVDLDKIAGLFKNG